MQGLRAGLNACRVGQECGGARAWGWSDPLGPTASDSAAPTSATPTTTPNKTTHPRASPPLPRARPQLGGAMMAREVVRDMRRRGEWGHIINMVGLSGHRIPDAAAGGSFFAATKFAVRAITDGLRQEVGAGVWGL